MKTSKRFITLITRFVALLAVAVLIAPAGSGNALADSRENNKLLRNFTEFSGTVRGHPAVVTEVTTSDGLTLKGLYWAGKANRPLIVFFPGWKPEFRYLERHLTPVIEAGYGVLAAINRGELRNPGSISDTGYYADADAYMAYARSVANGRPIILFGYSIGAPVAIHVASRTDVAGVITWGLFTKVSDINMAFASRAIPYPFASAGFIGQVSEPMVLMYGRDDGFVPASQGRELAARAGGPTAVIEMNGGSHFLNARVLLPVLKKTIAAILANDLSTLKSLDGNGTKVEIAASK